jgi:hypothetical protein
MKNTLLISFLIFLSTTSFEQSEYANFLKKFKPRDQPLIINSEDLLNKDDNGRLTKEELKNYLNISYAPFDENEDLYIAEFMIEYESDIVPFFSKAIYSKVTNIATEEIVPLLDSFDYRNCTICLEDFELNSDVSILNCNHIYHKECIWEWINLKNDIKLNKSIYWLIKLDAYSFS